MGNNFFLKNTLLLASLSGTGFIQAQQQPNIILFLVDDMGWQDTSVPFYQEPTLLNSRYRTPNMERLAHMGVKFTQAYACAVSSPTRCSLMTGMNAARHRVTNWTLYYNQKTDASSEVIQLPDWNYNGIQPAHTTHPVCRFEKLHSCYVFSSNPETERLLHDTLWESTFWRQRYFW